MTQTYKRPTIIELKKELEYIEDTIDLMLAQKPNNEYNWWFLSDEFNNMLRRRNLIQHLCA